MSLARAQVAQIYVARGSAWVLWPEMKLEAFGTILLQKGGSKPVELKPSEELAGGFWGQGGDRFDGGENSFDVLVGNSRADAVEGDLQDHRGRMVVWLAIEPHCIP